MTLSDPTIFALATPRGRAALAMIRISGPLAFDLFTFLKLPLPAPRVATLLTLVDPKTREKLDQAIVTVFKGPHSFTGDDSVEISLHGGRAVVEGVMSLLAHVPGFRLAEPGEFTKRAFLNHKMDLTEAEAIADLIDAETALQRRQALGQLGGQLSRLYGSWAERLTKVLAYTEAHIDFSDEDLPADLSLQMNAPIQALATEISTHLNDARRGERLRDGVQVVILGAPNAGKSTLLNALAQREVAIVSDIAGTTRDVLDVHLDLKGYPVTLTDTAGLREKLEVTGHDAIEAEGIRRALARADAADLKILLFDATTLPDLDSQTLALLDSRSVVVVNKTDQVDQVPSRVRDFPVVAISAREGKGLQEFLAALSARLEYLAGTGDTPSLTRARHRTALETCLAHLQISLAGQPLELRAEELRAALVALGRVTGRVDVEDLLDVIFRDFCLGK